MKFTILLFFDKNEKTPETLDFTGFSGGVFGVPEVIRTPDLPLRSLAFLLVRYTHHNFPLFLIRYGIVWLLVNLHKNP